jgi:hypothetical protein
VPAVGSFGGTLQCTLPRLEPGTSTTFTVTMRGEAKGTFVNTVAVTSDEVAAGFDSDMLNNTDERADDRPHPGRCRGGEQGRERRSGEPARELRFVVTVRNNSGAGRSEADNVTVRDTLPAGWS